MVNKHVTGFATRALVCCLTAIFTICPAYAGLIVRTVVLSGQAAPGGGGASFFILGTPFIDPAGRTAFNASVPVTGLGIWSETNGPLSLVALNGQAVAGEVGVSYGFVLLNSINAGGALTIDLGLNGPGVNADNNIGIGYADPGGAGLLWREDDVAPDTGGAVFRNVQSPALLNDSGKVVFGAGLRGSGVTPANGEAIWVGTPNTLGLVVRTGDAVPGWAGATFAPLSLTSTRINNAGDIAFQGSVTGAAVPPDAGGLWFEHQGVTQLVARTGAAAPGTVGATFEGFFEPTLNHDGEVAFTGLLTGPGVDPGDGVGSSGDSIGIWAGQPGALSPVARAGDAAPGIPGGVFNNLSDQLAFNTAGVAFLADVRGAGFDPTNNQGIWSNAGGTLDLLVRSGDAAPGTTGATFDVLNAPTMNTQGQAAFLGRVSGAGVTSANDFGVWATDLSGQLIKIVREGDAFDVNDDPLATEWRTISLITLMSGLGGEDGRGTSFNNAGQLGLRMSFTDGSSGIFVVAVPIPGDLNGDGFVGIADLNIVLGNWNQNVPPGNPLADPSGDNFVGIADLNIVLGYWNAGTPPANPSSIPEPASLTAWLLTGLSAYRRRA